MWLYGTRASLCYRLYKYVLGVLCVCVSGECEMCVKEREKEKERSEYGWPVPRSNKRASSTPSIQFHLRGACVASISFKSKEHISRKHADIKRCTLLVHKCPRAVLPRENRWPIKNWLFGFKNMDNYCLKWRDASTALLPILTMLNSEDSPSSEHIIAGCLRLKRNSVRRKETKKWMFKRLLIVFREMVRINLAASSEMGISLSRGRTTRITHTLFDSVVESHTIDRMSSPQFINNYLKCAMARYADAMILFHLSSNFSFFRYVVRNVSLEFGCVWVCVWGGGGRATDDCRTSNT